MVTCTSPVSASCGALSSSAQTDGKGAPHAGAPALLAEHISKTFGGERALDDVAFSVAPGEVHGLLGQNGSGKSTLIKVLSGFHHPDPGGHLKIYGNDVPLPVSVRSFRSLGLSFVHQHLGLVPNLTVLENLVVGDLATKQSAFLNWPELRRKALETFARFDLRLDPQKPVAELPQVERALLAIVRAFEDIRAEHEEHGVPGILFLDEPTPFLPKEGVEQLFTLVRGIVREGASVIFVSHDVDEVMEITTRATVLRDGRVAGTLVTDGATKDEFISMIIGRKVEPYQAVPQDFSAKAADISIENLSGGALGPTSLGLHKGEVVGLTGLIGSGFDEIPYLLFGARQASSGQVKIGDEVVDVVSTRPKDAIDRGLALLPADRLGAAGVGELTITDNMTLPVLADLRAWFGLDRPGMRNRAQTLGAEYDVRPNAPVMKLASLSGGNQQKVLLAKWLQTKPALLLLDEPTQGVDVGARQQVFGAIAQASEQGSAVICASTDYEQLSQICDRVFIFARGQIVQELRGADVTKDRIAEQTLLSLSLLGATTATDATGANA